MIRRTKAVHGDGSGAITPDLIGSGPSPAQELNWLRKLLAAERRRHGQVERILTRQVDTLERQVADLRRLYFEGLKLEVSGR